MTEPPGRDVDHHGAATPSHPRPRSRSQVHSRQRGTSAPSFGRTGRMRPASDCANGVVSADPRRLMSWSRPAVPSSIASACHRVARSSCSIIPIARRWTPRWSGVAKSRDARRSCSTFAVGLATSRTAGGSGAFTSRRVSARRGRRSRHCRCRHAAPWRGGRTDIGRADRDDPEVQAGEADQPAASCRPMQSCALPGQRLRDPDGPVEQPAGPRPSLPGAEPRFSACDGHPAAPAPRPDGRGASVYGPPSGAACRRGNQGEGARAPRRRV